MKIRIGLRKGDGVVYRISGTERELWSLVNTVTGLLWTGTRAVEMQIGDRLVVVEKEGSWRRSSGGRSRAGSKRG